MGHYLKQHVKGLFFLVEIVLLLSFSNIYAQDGQILGRIYDEMNNPLPGVNVYWKGTTVGAITDFDGNYRLKTNENTTTLVISSIGFQTREIEYKGQSTLDVRLQPDAQELEEIVVIGYGTQKAKDVTGATSVLSSKETELQPTPRAQDMLQGKVAGVVVSQNSGAPGSAPAVNIRGFTGNPVYVVDGFIGADFTAINPNDIENITVLKDASATAIYGSRGANGVILVTTKSGKKNSPLKVDLSYDHTISQTPKELEILDPSTYMTLVNKKAVEANANEFFTQEEIDLAGRSKATNWQDEIFRVAHSNNYNVNLTKGWKTSSLRFSLGARQDEGIVRNTDYERLTGRLNYNWNVTKSTKINVNAAYTRENMNNLNDRGDGKSQPIFSSLIWSPNMPVYNEDGTYSTFEGYGSSVRENPVYLTDEINKNAINNTFNTNLSLEQKLTNDLSIKAFGAYKSRVGTTDGSSRWVPGAKKEVVRHTLGDNDFFQLQGSLQLNYNKKINDNHSIDVVAVTEGMRMEGNRYSRTASIDPTVLDEIPNYIDNNPSYTPEGMVSFLVRAGYNYKDKLLVTGSVRSDGSSRLPEGNRWGTFMSGAVAYRLSEEAFLKDVDWIENLKLRIGYGETGNVNSLSAFQVQDVTNPNFRDHTYDENVLVPTEGVEDGSKRANQNLIWETSQQFNGGVDFEVLEGRVGLSVDYYSKYTNDMHFNEPVHYYMGGGSIKTNSGTFRNNGIEMQLSTQLVEGEDFTFSTTFNFAYNKSEVIELPRDSIYASATIRNVDAFDRESHLVAVGQPVGQLYGYQYNGVDPSTGQPIYQNFDDNPLITIDDMTVLGNGHPDFTWGLNLNMGYKNFSLNVFFQGMHGQDVYNLPRYAMYGVGSGSLNGTSPEILNSWTVNKENPTLPSLNSNYEAQSSMFVEDGSFVKLRNVTLAYDFSEKLLDKIKLQNARVYVSGQNLLTITDYSGLDPESKSKGKLTPGIDEGSYPIPMSFIFGLKVGI